MTVKESEELLEELEAARAALTRAEAALLREDSEPSGITVRELSERFGVPEDAVMAFVETVGELLGDRPLDPQTARRGALVAAAGLAWDNELGPLLSSRQVREMLGGVSRQRVDELLRFQRLIGLRDGGGRRRFPAFQFADGQPLEPLISAFWTVAESVASDWTAAAWCVAPDQALGGLTPLDWARAGRDAELLGAVARHDAGRLAR